MLIPATPKELPVEQAIFNEAWSMVKDYHSIQEWGNDAEWKKVGERGERLFELGKEKPELKALSRGMALLITDYLQKIGRGKGDKEACIAARKKQREREETIQKLFNSI